MKYLILLVFAVSLFAQDALLDSKVAFFTGMNADSTEVSGSSVRTITDTMTVYSGLVGHGDIFGIFGVSIKFIGTGSQSFNVYYRRYSNVSGLGAWKLIASGIGVSDYMTEYNLSNNANWNPSGKGIYMKISSTGSGSAEHAVGVTLK